MKGRVHWADYFKDPELIEIRKRKFDKISSDAEYEDVDNLDEDDPNDADFVEPSAKKLRRGPKVRRESGASGSVRSVVLHACERCTFTTNNKKQLMMHSTLHRTNVEPMLCPYDGCPAQSFTTADLKKHIYEAHDGPSKLPRQTFYCCKGCEPLQFFNDSQDAFNHVVFHVETIATGYRCLICQHTASKFEKFNEHAKNHIHQKCTFCESVYPKPDQVERYCICIFYPF